MARKKTTTNQHFDLVVVGGGVNGSGIARDAAGRGLSVLLVEMDDLAHATSSASTKLFHGGLRYLEYFEIGLVKKALKEREVLLRAMPHISWPMRFVLPWHSAQRFDMNTPVSRLLSWVMPWMKGRRPSWLIRMGLFIYDNMGGRDILPATRRLDLTSDETGQVLAEHFKGAYEYSDCWVDDARLTVLNAVDAKRLGADIRTRTKVTEARRDGDQWALTLDDLGAGTTSTVHAKTLINASGPWAADFINEVSDLSSRESIRLVRGSHIVVPKIFDHDKAYFLQGEDGRITFAIPYEGKYTLIGTTDRDHADPDTPAQCSEDEIAYLCDFVSTYFKKPVRPEDVVWTYSGLRPLYDDGASSASAATREYVLTLNLNEDGRAPLLNIFGGKITTHRKLAEAALKKIATFHPEMTGPWTASASLPGGDFPHDGVADLTAALRAKFNYLTDEWADRLIRCYGTLAQTVLAEHASAKALGTHFGADLYEAEVSYLMANEFAKSAEDVVWRRTKVGLAMSAKEIEALDQWMKV